MPDWTRSMQQTFEYYRVDPDTWADTERIDNVISSNIKRDSSNDTLGSASFTVSEDLGELYIRTYLVTTQDRIRERTPLGTHLCQTTGEDFDGKYHSITLDAYTPLIELKEKCPPIGYAIAKDQNIMRVASNLVKENVRAPVISAQSSYTLPQPFVADIKDTWFSFISDLIACGYYEFYLDELGRVMFAPLQDTKSLQPIWAYNDSNSSILQPSINTDRDLYGIPNVLEVTVSDNGNAFLYSKVVNDDPNSPISTVTRGREVVQRITDPDIYGTPTQVQLDDYARRTLKELSSLEYTLTYSHGYCPVRVGDCVLLNYDRAGIHNVKAKVTRQSIRCETGCQVEETAIYTDSLWG